MKNYFPMEIYWSQTDPGLTTIVWTSCGFIRNSPWPHVKSEHEVMTCFLTVQQDSDLPPWCVFTVGEHHENEHARKVLSRGLLTFICVRVVDKTGVIDICNIRINDLSFYDGLKTIAEGRQLNLSSSALLSVTFYSIVSSCCMFKYK